jgi:hypothetical protein
MRKLYMAPDWDGVLWDFKGGQVNLNDIPLSDDLRSALHDWLKLHSKIWEDEEYKNDATAQLDWKLLDLRGVELWKRVRQELAGQCDVVYASHIFNDYFSDPEHLESLLRTSRPHNKRSPEDAGFAFLFHAGRYWSGASDSGRSAPKGLRLGHRSL